MVEVKCVPCGNTTEGHAKFSVSYKTLEYAVQYIKRHLEHKHPDWNKKASGPGYTIC